MRPLHPHLAKIELVAEVLAHCAISWFLWAVARVTYDVDLVARVEALTGYHALEKRFASLGFKRDMAQDAPICRWRYNNLEVDLMSMDSGVLGFRWYPRVVQTAGGCAVGWHDHSPDRRARIHGDKIRGVLRSGAGRSVGQS